MDVPSLWINILIVLFLVGANGFFVAAEFALVQARRTRIDEMVEEGDFLARRVAAAQDDLDRSISGTQLGITISSIALGWVGVVALAEPLSRFFQDLAGAWAEAAGYGVAVALAFALIVFLHIVLGELVPKTVALIRPEAVSRWVAVPVDLFNRVMAPAIWVLNGAASLVIRTLGWEPLSGSERVHSPEEIRVLLERGRERGVVERDEEAMIHGVFDLTLTVAREVMTPRTDIVAVSADATAGEVLRTAIESGFSRFPVYGESLDDIVGILLVKDCLPWFTRHTGEPFEAGKVAREAVFVPETKPVDDLLAELRWRKVHMAVVVDEFGGTDGIVTMEDLLEEIVGDIYDEHDEARVDIRREPDGRVLVAGGASLSDVLRKFDLGEVEEEYDTVAGYVIGELGRIPETGERVALNGAEVEVLEIRDRRVIRLELHLPPKPEEGAPEGGPEASGEPGSGRATGVKSGRSPESEGART